MTYILINRKNLKIKKLIAFALFIFIYVNNATNCSTGEYSLKTLEYVWSTGDHGEYNVLYPSRKTIFLTVNEDNGNEVTDSIIVNESDVKSVLGEITIAFTPNGDGVHDKWEINNINFFPKARIEVFDRWGRLVFRVEDGYHNDWDGTSNGRMLPVDRYFYIIYPGEPGTKPIEGTVTIIR